MKRHFLFIFVGAAIVGIWFTWRASKTPRAAPASSGVTTKGVETGGTNDSVRFKSDTFKRISRLRKDRLDAPSAQDEDRAKSRRLVMQAEQELGRNKSIGPVKELLRAALELDRYNAHALSNLSELLMDENDLLEARELATQCLGVDEKNLVCHRVLVSSFTRTGNWDEAYPFLSDCLTVDQKDIICLGAMSLYELNAGQLNKSKELVDQLKQLDPGSIWTELAEADYFFRAGKREAAIPHYKAACAKGQSYACSQYKQLQN